MQIKMIGGKLAAVSENVRDMEVIIGLKHGPIQSEVVVHQRKQIAPSYRKQCDHCDRKIKTRGMKLHVMRIHSDHNWNNSGPTATAPAQPQA